MSKNNEKVKIGIFTLDEYRIFYKARQFKPYRKVPHRGSELQKFLNTHKERRELKLEKWGLKESLVPLFEYALSATIELINPKKNDIIRKLNHLAEESDDSISIIREWDREFKEKTRD